MRKRPSRGEGAVSALIDAENGHGLGQGIDRFLMLARVVQGLSVRPQLLHLGQLLGTEGGPAARASSIFFMSMGQWKARRCRKRAGRPTTA